VGISAGTTVVQLAAIGPGVAWIDSSSYLFQFMGIATTSLYVAALSVSEILFYSVKFALLTYGSYSNRVVMKILRELLKFYLTLFSQLYSLGCFSCGVSSFSPTASFESYVGSR
jgi:hypothetical protein